LSSVIFVEKMDHVEFSVTRIRSITGNEIVFTTARLYLQKDILGQQWGKQPAGAAA
jgi:hypothetical protein